MAEIKLTVRLPEVLHAQIVDWARNDRRSLNNAIVVLLQEALERHKIYLDDPVKPQRRRPA
jgi:hypothetical protein